jgi:hypothetical protein
MYTLFDVRPRGFMPGGLLRMCSSLRIALKSQRLSGRSDSISHDLTPHQTASSIDDSHRSPNFRSIRFKSGKKSAPRS